MLKGVVVRVDRPDNFIQGLEDVPRSFGNGVDLGCRCSRMSFSFPDQFTDIGDARQFGSDFIVHVPGNANTVALDFILLRQPG